MDLIRLRKFIILFFIFHGKIKHIFCLILCLSHLSIYYYIIDIYDVGIEFI